MVQKQNFIKCICLVFTLSLFYLNGNSQALIKLLLNSGQIYQSGSLMVDDQLKGYYYMYEVDKIGKGISKFKLEIMDPNLNIVAAEEFNHSNTSDKFQLYFNGDQILTQNYHTRERESKINLYDLGLNKINNYSKEKKSMFENRTTIIPLEFNGFLEIEQITKPSRGIKLIHKIDNKVQWEKIFNEDIPTLKNVELIDSNLICYFDYHNTIIRNDSGYLLGLSLNDGRELFKKNVKDPVYKQVKYIGLKEISNSKFVVMNFYANNILNSTYKGLLIKKYDKNGKEISANKIDFKDQIFRNLSKISGFQQKHIRINEIIEMNDGKYLVFGQAYTIKQNKSTIIYVIHDAFALTLNDDLKVRTIRNFEMSMEKRRTSNFRSFDMIVQSNKDKSVVSFFYPELYYTNRFFRIKKPKLTYHTYSNNSWTAGELFPKYDDQYLRYSRAKFGYILISEYDRKNRTYENRLEKYNY